MSLETRLFAYGTLKRGSPVHEQLCPGVSASMPAQVWGRLYELPSGCPALVVPPAARMRAATADPAADQAYFAQAAEVPAPACSHVGWRPIRGQLLTLGDFRTAWTTLDAWEDAAPGHPSVFRRTLIPVEGPDGLHAVAWAYVVPELPARARELVGPEWPLPVSLRTGEA